MLWLLHRQKYHLIVYHNPFSIWSLDASPSSKGIHRESSRHVMLCFNYCNPHYPSNTLLPTLDVILDKTLHSSAATRHPFKRALSAGRLAKEGQCALSTCNWAHGPWPRFFSILVYFIQISSRMLGLVPNHKSHHDHVLSQRKLHPVLRIIRAEKDWSTTQQRNVFLGTFDERVFEYCEMYFFRHYATPYSKMGRFHIFHGALSAPGSRTRDMRSAVCYGTIKTVMTGGCGSTHLSDVIKTQVVLTNQR